jgi:Ca2+-binding EF-hand superfamily protein
VRTLADGLPDAIPGDVRRAFHRIDENSSGQLDYTELRAALKELANPNPNPISRTRNRTRNRTRT